MEYAIRNAVIESVRFDNERGLSAWLTLNYGGSGQGFGGFMLYAPDGWTAHNSGGDYTGHFVYRCMEIAGADDWNKMVGKTIRVRLDHDGLSGTILAIGHIINDVWFEPRAEFAEMTGAHKKVREELSDQMEMVARLRERIAELEVAELDARQVDPMVAA